MHQVSAKPLLIRRERRRSASEKDAGMTRKRVVMIRFVIFYWSKTRVFSLAYRPLVDKVKTGLEGGLS